LNIITTKEKAAKTETNGTTRANNLRRILRKAANQPTADPA
jgi:hypothetical protein